jgi:hypothetical protein
MGMGAEAYWIWAYFRQFFRIHTFPSSTCHRRPEKYCSLLQTSQEDRRIGDGRLLTTRRRTGEPETDGFLTIHRRIREQETDGG